MRKFYERGKLLGVLNVIDVIIILIVIGILAGGGLYLKNISIKDAVGVFTYVIEFKDVPNDLVQYIVEGEEVADSEMFYTIGRIVSIDIKPMMNIVENKNAGIYEQKEVPNKSDVFITVQAEYRMSGDGVDTIENIMIGNFEVKAGKLVYVNSKQYAGQGYIVSIDK